MTYHERFGTGRGGAGQGGSVRVGPPKNLLAQETTNPLALQRTAHSYPLRTILRKYEQNEFLYKPTEEQNPLLTTCLPATCPLDDASLLASLLSSGPTPVCLC